MFLGKRRWTLRLMEAAEIDVRSVEGDALVQVVLHQAKNGPPGPGGDKGAVIRGAMSAIDGFRATQEMTDIFGLSLEQSYSALARLSVGVEKILDQTTAQRSTGKEHH